VGVDGRQGGRDALALAALLQRTGGGELMAVRVYQCDRSVDFDQAEREEAALAQELRADLEGELTRAGVSARAYVVTDPAPARALHTLAEAGGADLIVVGSSHLAGAARVFAGDDAIATLRGAPCAVAVAPREFGAHASELRLIGVALSEAPESRDALELGRRLAARAGARVRAIHVVQPEHLGPIATFDAAWPNYDASARRTGERLLDDVLGELRDDVEAEVLVGTAWQALAARTEELDLLMVGSRPHGTLRRLALGSTSTELVRRSSCPVLLPPRGAM
jgi:nucleotide-binding universal stress UspA family protein